MEIAPLEVMDYLIFGILVFYLVGGQSSAKLSAATEERLRRIEDKLNVLLAHHGIDYFPKTKEPWQRSADDGLEERAAEEYRDAHSVELEEAKEVVKQYREDSRLLG